MASSGSGEERLEAALKERDYLDGELTELLENFQESQRQLRAEREAREKATYQIAHWRDEGARWKDQLNEALVRAEKAEEALRAFASPVSTSRVGDGDQPELDTLTLEVKAGDWIRACVVLGTMDVAYLRRLYEPARPSEEFIASLSALPVKKEERDEALVTDLAHSLGSRNRNGSEYIGPFNIEDWKTLAEAVVGDLRRQGWLPAPQPEEEKDGR